MTKHIYKDCMEYVDILLARKRLLPTYLCHVRRMKALGQQHVKLSRFVEIVLKKHCAEPIVSSGFTMETLLEGIYIPVFVKKK